jgi:hypothetical protein
MALANRLENPSHTSLIGTSKTMNWHLGDIFAMSFFWLWKLNSSNPLLSQRSLQIKKISVLQNNALLDSSSLNV